MAVTLYGCPLTFYSQRIIMVLEEKSIPYKSHIVNLGTFENLAHWFMRINPNGKIPVLEHNGKYILDSKEITSYLEREFGGPAMIPDNNEIWSHFQTLFENINIEVLTHGGACFPHFTKDSKMPTRLNGAIKKLWSSSGKRVAALTAMLGTTSDHALKEAYEKKLASYKQMEEFMVDEEMLKDELMKTKEALQEINAELKANSENKWLCGPEFTLADTDLSILLHRLDMVGYSTVIWKSGKLPEVEAFYHRVMKRKSFQNACTTSYSFMNVMRFAYGSSSVLWMEISAVSALLLGIGLGAYLTWKK